jgi:hypothetical protein
MRELAISSVTFLRAGTDGRAKTMMSTFFNADTLL